MMTSVCVCGCTFTIWCGNHGEYYLSEIVESSKMTLVVPIFGMKSSCSKTCVASTNSVEVGRRAGARCRGRRLRRALALHQAFSAADL